MNSNTRIFRLSLLSIIAALTTLTASAQRKSAVYERYIKQYAPLAVEHQKRYKIPASITLAQGLLESGAGQSELARQSNNHFGIKCHSDWKGGRVYHDDDYKGECFRKYKSADQSYEDHSLFLTQRPRYAELFRLNIRDYKGWAKGLQKCGYATDKAYANRLIKIIEDYELYAYDTAKATSYSRRTTSNAASSKAKGSYTIYKSNGLLYVHSNGSDNIASIAESLGFSARALRGYNEIPDDDFPLQQGDIVYLEKKKSKADKPNYDHVVQMGESMHSIAQKYGIRVKSLYKLNKKDKDYVPEEGDVLKLR
jgi:LysM repeat protein